MARKSSQRKPVRIEPIFVTQMGFARLTGLPYTFVRRMVALGDLPTRLIGTRLYIIRELALESLQREVA